MQPKPTTKRCSRCHVTKPVAAFHGNRSRPDGLHSYCWVCMLAYLRERSRANPESVKRYRATLKHKEQARARHRAYYQKHRAVMLAKDAARRKLRPELNRAQVSRHRAIVRGVFVENVVVAVLAERDRNRCGICHRYVAVPERSIDHVLPLSKGGAHSYANTRLTHRVCNSRRSNRGHAQLRLIG